MRGSAVDSSRSRNSHIRAPRSVTRAPIDMPSRSLNAAIDFRAFVTTGFCPVMMARSSTAASRSLLSRTASPTPMFTTIFSSRGTRMGPGRPELLLELREQLLPVPLAQPRRRDRRCLCSFVRHVGS